MEEWRHERVRVATRHNRLVEEIVHDLEIRRKRNRVQIYHVQVCYCSILFCYFTRYFKILIIKSRIRCFIYLLKRNKIFVFLKSMYSTRRFLNVIIKLITEYNNEIQNEASGYTIYNYNHCPNQIIWYFRFHLKVNFT